MPRSGRERRSHATSSHTAYAPNDERDEHALVQIQRPVGKVDEGHAPATRSPRKEDASLGVQGSAAESFRRAGAAATSPVEPVVARDAHVLEREVLARDRRGSARGIRDRRQRRAICSAAAAYAAGEKSSMSTPTSRSANSSSRSPIAVVTTGTPAPRYSPTLVGDDGDLGELRLEEADREVRRRQVRLDLVRRRAGDQVVRRADAGRVELAHRGPRDRTASGQGRTGRAAAGAPPRRTRPSRAPCSSPVNLPT